MICNKLIPLDKPFQFENRCNFIGSIITSAASHVNAGLNYITQRNTNKRNQDIAHEANEYNWRGLLEQERYNTEMWDKQVAYNDKMNEYNSASEQRKRLEAAGLNPYLMMDGGSAGSSQSSPGAIGVNPPSATSIPYQAPQFNIGFDGSDLDNYLLQKDVLKATARKSNADAEHTEIENQTYGAQLMQMIDNMIADTHDKTAAAALKQWQIAQGSALLGSTLRLQNNQADLLKQQGMTESYNTLSKQYEAMYANEKLKNYPEEFKKSMALYDAQIYAAYQQGDMSLQQANLLHEQKLTEQVRRYGMRQDNFLKRYTTAEASWRAYSVKQDAITSHNNALMSRVANGPFARSWIGLFNMLLSPLRGVFSGSVSKSYH